MTTKRPAQEVEKLGPMGNTAQAQKWACTRTRTIARFHLLIFFFFLDVQKSCKNHTLTLKCLIPHLNRLVFIWRQWTDHLWTYKTMDHKSGTKSDNKMQKTQIEKDDDAEKNTLTTTKRIHWKYVRGWYQALVTIWRCSKHMLLCTKINIAFISLSNSSSQ